jgi:hypothetical protein
VVALLTPSNGAERRRARAWTTDPSRTTRTDDVVAILDPAIGDGHGSTRRSVWTLKCPKRA